MTANQSQEQGWLVIHTRPQWEAIVCRQLKQWYNISYYCPYQSSIAKYTDRMKQVEKPLFKSYVFVRPVSQFEQLRILELDGVTNFVKQLGKPAIVRDSEMQKLQEFINTHKKLAVKEIGAKVRKTKGALEGIEGHITHISRNTATLHVPQLGYTLIAQLSELEATS